MKKGWNWTKKYLGIEKVYQFLGRRGWRKLKGLTLFTVVSLLWLNDRTVCPPSPVPFNAKSHLDHSRLEKIYATFKCLTWHPKKTGFYWIRKKGLSEIIWVFQLNWNPERTMRKWLDKEKWNQVSSSPSFQDQSYFYQGKWEKNHMTYKPLEGDLTG